MRVAAVRSVSGPCAGDRMWGRVPWQRPFRRLIGPGRGSHGAHRPAALICPKKSPVPARGS